MTQPSPQKNNVGQLRDAIVDACRRLGLTASPEAQEKLAEYCVELCRWNRKINLTGAGDPVSFAKGPLFDAMTLVPVMVETASFVDIGSGGGLPGIPAAIVTGQSNITLVEPRAKRATFLRHIVHHLSLDATVRTARIEHLEGETWHAAAAQAVFEPHEWIERACEIVSPGGVIYVLSAKAVQRRPEMEAVFQQRHPVTGADRFAYRLRG